MTVVQKTIIDALGKGKVECSQSAVSKHRMLSGRQKCGRKRSTSSRNDRSLEGIVRKRPFKCVGKRHKEWTEAVNYCIKPPHTDRSWTWASHCLDMGHNSFSKVSFGQALTVNRRVLSKHQDNVFFHSRSAAL